MKSGIELIAEERAEQLSKHNRTVEKDVRENGSYQLAIGASKLLAYPAECHNYQLPPTGWSVDIYKKMRDKPYKERLIIAGALIAAELDRLQAGGEK
ncbi:MAG: hypothetical protein IPF70_22185 [Saprospiraceae bacterium]|nr:hypothetical protein [Saprospiraceae bacterium]